MAATDGHLPAAVGADGDQRAERRASSPGPSQSKRDKKRQILTDRLAALSEKFSRDRDMTYREQLQKIQVDNTLVMRLDPYAERPLESLGQDKRELARDPDPDGRGGGRGLLEMAGPTFLQWAQEIEDLVEERDSNLTKQKYEYEKKAQEHKNTHLFKTETTNREHRQLAATLRERLINAITARKVRLTKEKEALEISDASALLLHPNQFSLTNPSSPGGSHSKRTMRLRPVADDLLGLGDSRKRKRNGGGNDDDGSPAPQRRGGNGGDAGGTTAMWQTVNISSRRPGGGNGGSGGGGGHGSNGSNGAGPLFTIDKLFTDKELAMTYNTAALAAHKYLLMHRTKHNSKGELVSAASPSDGEGGGGVGGGGGSGSGGHHGGDGSGDDDDDGDDHHHNRHYHYHDAASAPAMERVPSHTTRSTRGGTHHPSGGGGGAGAGNFVDDRLVGLEALTNFEMPGSLEKLAANEPKMPPLFMSNYAKPHSKMDANTPSTLSADDVHSDLAVMRLLRQYEAAHGVGSNLDNINGGRRVLEATAFSPHDSRYQAYLRHDREDPEELRRDLRLPGDGGGGGSSASPGTLAAASHGSGSAAAISSAAAPTSAPSRGNEPATPSGVHPVAAGGAGASPMSRQSSQGGAAMSRQGSSTRAQRKRNQ